MECSTIAVHSINGWTGECIYENQEGYEKGAFVSKDSPYNTFFKFYNDNAWPYIQHMMAGGAMTPCQSSTTEIRLNLLSTS